MSGIDRHAYQCGTVADECIRERSSWRGTRGEIERGDSECLRKRDEVHGSLIHRCNQVPTVEQFLLLAHESLSAEVVEVVTRTVFSETPRIVEGHPEASRINVRTGISTGEVPLHEGAMRWFRSVKR